MKTIKTQGRYALVYSEIDKEYQIYVGEEYQGGHQSEVVALESFERACGKGELLDNEI